MWKVWIKVDAAIIIYFSSLSYKGSLEVNDEFLNKYLDRQSLSYEFHPISIDTIRLHIGRIQSKFSKYYTETQDMSFYPYDAHKLLKVYRIEKYRKHKFPAKCVYSYVERL